MDLRNQSYQILIHTKSGAERYYRDRKGWVKVSTRGRRFRATAEQVLNHLLPALAGIKKGLHVEVRHRPRRRPWRKIGARKERGTAGPKPGPRRTRKRAA